MTEKNLGRIVGASTRFSNGDFSGVNKTVSIAKTTIFPAERILVGDTVVSKDGYLGQVSAVLETTVNIVVRSRIKGDVGPMGPQGEIPLVGYRYPKYSLLNKEPKVTINTKDWGELYPSAEFMFLRLWISEGDGIKPNYIDFSYEMLLHMANTRYDIVDEYYDKGKSYSADMIVSAVSILPPTLLYYNNPVRRRTDMQIIINFNYSSHVGSYYNVPRGIRCELWGRPIDPLEGVSGYY